MRTLVDSHVLVWAATRPGRLTDAGRRLIASRRNDALISVASLWELSIKVSLGKLELPEAPEIMAQRLGLAELPIRHAHLARLRMLPHLHRDPFDRLLIAQAIEEGLTLLTDDAAVQRYPVTWLW